MRITFVAKWFVHVHMWTKWCRNWSHRSGVGSFKCHMRLQSWEKVFGLCTAQCKVLLFHAKIIVRVMQFKLGHLKMEKKIKKADFGHLASFWFGTFTVAFCTTRRSLVGHQSTRKWRVHCHTVFGSLREATVLRKLMYCHILGVCTVPT